MAREEPPDRPGAGRWVPIGAGLDGLRAAARECRGCELYAPATQTVFGAGEPTARVVLVGEQPGDQEDRAGEPFVGPAGRLLDRALADAGIERADAYVTNAVKHFRFTQAGPGKRRIHQTPDTVHVGACRPWLVAELAVLDPEVVVCLGAVAAKALLGPAFRVTRQRGHLLPWAGLPESALARGGGTSGGPSAAAPGTDATAGASTADRTPGGGTADRTPAGTADGRRQAAWALATLHPSAVLRADDREAAYAGLVSDLTVAAEALA